MKWILATVVLLLAGTLLAQQEQMTPNPLPSSSMAMEQQQPATANSDVMHQIQSRLSTDSHLNNTGVNTVVSDHQVILDGYVDNEHQRDIATGIAEQFSDGRQIVDQIQVGGSPGEGTY